MRSKAIAQGPVRRNTAVTSASGTIVTLADVRRRWLIRQTRQVARPAPEPPTAANLPMFLRTVCDEEGPRQPEAADLHQLARLAGMICGLALLSWLAWDATPPIEWLRAIGPTVMPEIS